MTQPTDADQNWRTGIDHLCYRLQKPLSNAFMELHVCRNPYDAYYDYHYSYYYLVAAGGGGSKGSRFSGAAVKHRCFYRAP